jgi:hypothetical protein
LTLLLNNAILFASEDDAHARDRPVSFSQRASGLPQKSKDGVTMALKRKLTKAEHSALNPLLQAEYKAEGEDFVLDATGFEDPGELRRALARVREEKTTLETELTTARTKIDTITAADARRAGDVATLEKSWQDKLDAEKRDATKKLEAKDKFLQTTLVDSVASKLATEVGGDNADLLVPHIKSRLSAELTGEIPLTRVLDKDGKPSAMTVEDLRKEIETDKRFASVVIKSKASGGGAAGAGRPAGGGAASGRKFKELNDKERTEWYKRDPDGFTQASKVPDAVVA